MSECRNCVRKCRLHFCVHSKKSCIFALQFQQLPYCVIDWGTIKNVIINNDSNASDILDALCISIFACGYYFSTSYCLLLWCCLSFIPAIVFRLFGIVYNLNLQFRIRHRVATLRTTDNGRAVAGSLLTAFLYLLYTIYSFAFRR